MPPPPGGGGGGGGGRIIGDRYSSEKMNRHAATVDNNFLGSQNPSSQSHNDANFSKNRLDRPPIKLSSLYLRTVMHVFQ